MISPLSLQHEQAVEQCACHTSQGGGGTGAPSLDSLAAHEGSRAAG